MKKVLFLLTAVSGLFLASCKNQDVAPDATSLDEVFSSMASSAARTAAVNDTITKG